jgi:hypothetical protein
MKVKISGKHLIKTNGKRDFNKYKENALALAENRIKHFNQVYNFDINRIFIKNQRSRWGSCSSNKNLNFNYKIVFLEPHLADYIIVHELCHLKELNHSKRFWNLVGQCVPLYRDARRGLKNYVFIGR